MSLVHQFAKLGMRNLIHIRGKSTRSIMDRRTGRSIDVMNDIVSYLARDRCRSHEIRVFSEELEYGENSR